MIQWSENAWNNSKGYFQQILDLPFIQELIDGSLPRGVFEFYLQQDAHYLEEYGKVLAALGARMPEGEWRSAFLRFSEDTLTVEKALHESFIGTIAVEDRIAASPSGMLYTGFLYTQLASHSLEEAVASVLPCFRVYQEVGNFILAQPQHEDNPYASWIATYGGADFGRAVKLAEAIADGLADAASPQRREQMDKVYLLAVKMEWLFWHSARQQEKWPL